MTQTYFLSRGPVIPSTQTRSCRSLARFFDALAGPMPTPPESGLRRAGKENLSPHLRRPHPSVYARATLIQLRDDPLSLIPETRYEVSVLVRIESHKVVPSLGRSVPESAKVLERVPGRDRLVVGLVDGTDVADWGIRVRSGKWIKCVFSLVSAC